MQIIPLSNPCILRIPKIELQAKDFENAILKTQTGRYSIAD